MKNLIILSNGENVSPEQIENRYSDEPLIKEIRVYEKNNSIAADIYPDYPYAREHGITDVAMGIEAVVKRVNMSGLSSHEIDSVNVITQPLERTSSGKLIRK